MRATDARVDNVHVEEPLIELAHAMARFTELVGEAEGDEPVPGCPGWTVGDLVGHLGGVHRWAAATLLTGQRLPDVEVRPTEPLDEWYAGQATALLTVMNAVDPDEPVLNFARIDEIAAFWPRRQLHEVTVHAVDVAQALSRPEYGWDVDPQIAADGISELIRVFFPRMTARGTRPRVDEVIELTATDLGRSWILLPGTGPDEPPALAAPGDLDPGNPEVDGWAMGTAVELYLTLWGRLPVDRLDLDGLAVDEFFAGPRVP